MRGATVPHRSVAGALAAMRAGRSDPTIVLQPAACWRATLTPDGPGTVHIRWGAAGVDADAWGPGAAWLLARVEAMCGLLDPGPTIEPQHDAVGRALRNHPTLRLGASGTPYHDLLPTVIAQRITAGEAVRQWSTLVRRLGEPAPGPQPGLLLPPSPDVLSRRPLWWFHPLGIEAARARTLVDVARHARHVTAWADLGPVEWAERMHALRGIGPWTTGVVRGISFGDPDAVPVGDFHVKHQVCFALSGRTRGTDDEMLDLLAPYTGQRGRVVQLLLADGWKAPAYGPRQRILPMARW